LRVIGLAGWSGAGKTSLLARVIPCLRRQGVSVSTLKHAHHAFDVDQPGKDSWVHRQAGAQQVLVASAHRWALMTEHRGAPEPALGELLRQLAPVDLVLIEGFKREGHPKLEVHRAANEKPWLYPEDRRILAVASDIPPPAGAPPRLVLDDTDGIAGALLRLAAGGDACRA
jgi:molybdopterin-guanine dinucleotide biosynthesis protein B